MINVKDVAPSGDISKGNFISIVRANIKSQMVEYFSKSINEYGNFKSDSTNIEQNHNSDY